MSIIETVNVIGYVKILRTSRYHKLKLGEIYKIISGPNISNNNDVTIDIIDDEYNTYKVSLDKYFLDNEIVFTKNKLDGELQEYFDSIIPYTNLFAYCLKGSPDPNMVKEGDIFFVENHGTINYKFFDIDTKELKFVVADAITINDFSLIYDDNASINEIKTLLRCREGRLM